MCRICGGPKSDGGRWPHCTHCAQRQRLSLIADTTLAELRGGLSLNQYHAKIRGWSRSVYDGPRRCLECGYSLHVDICHVRDVSTFALYATIGEVNAPENLIALCKNHHWEFDNGFLTIRSITKHRPAAKNKAGAGAAGVS
ncbi:HNH endonuclease [Nocardioides sp. InS609-2]|uniref:HNH endonuclease n=1 Tax=Nocardioides sp. InS609-2 TaxID=2760705 RepID=UPI0020BFD2F6|nr:HNH endonuclease [Nocardioides sp. InS609-2]